MNKRICFILLPILAILFSCSGRADNGILYRSAAECSITGAPQQTHTAHTFSLTRDDNHQQKNRIRIKAWDDYSAMDVPGTWVQLSRVFYFTRPAYAGYKTYARSLRLAAYNLRGPPAGNA